MKLIAPEQCRAARAMLGWSREDLARKSTVGYRTLVDFERGARQPYPRTIRDLQEALQTAGIEFLFPEDGRGPGLRMNAPPEEDAD
jgi:transcriptional regulator with XRE-family HTH domain